MSFGKLVDGHLADLVGHYAAADGILHLSYRTRDAGIDACGVLEYTVASGIKGTVFERNAIHITKRLFTRNVTADKLDVPAVPSEVFAVEFRVVNRDIVALPKGVLCSNLGVVHLYILAILEDVLGIGNQSINVNIFREHKRIGAVMQSYVFQLQPVDAPEGLIGIVDGDFLKFKVFHLAEELGAVNHAIAHHHVVAIPNGRAAAWSKVATRDQAAVNMPPRVLAIELGVVTFHIVTTLDARLAVGNRDILEHHIVGAKERAFAPKGQIVNRIHG